MLIYGNVDQHDLSMRRFCYETKKPAKQCRQEDVSERLGEIEGDVGFPRIHSWEVCMEFKKGIFQAWKLSWKMTVFMESHGKVMKFHKSVMEFFNTSIIILGV